MEAGDKTISIHDAGTMKRLKLMRDGTYAEVVTIEMTMDPSEHAQEHLDLAASGSNLSAHALEHAGLGVAAVNLKAQRDSRIAAWNAGPMVVAPAWAASTAYTSGVGVVLPNGTHLSCATGGTSGASAPTGYYDGRPITDGTVTWYVTGFQKSTSDVSAPTVTYAASAAAAGLSETLFANNGVPNFVKSNDAVLFSFGTAYLGRFNLCPGNSSFGANATGNVTSGSAAGFPISVATGSDSFAATQADIEQYVTDSKFMVTFHNSSSTAVILVDGQPLNGSLPVTSGTSGSGVVIDFGGVIKRRRLTISTFGSTNPAVRGIALTSQGYCEPIEPGNDNVLLLGDSYGFTTSPAYDGVAHIGFFLKRYLGVTGLANMCVGGSGYVSANANTYNVPAVLSRPNNLAVINYLAPRHVVVLAGFNDRIGCSTNQTTLANVLAAALATWRAIRALLPNAKITITDGHSGSSGPDADALALAAGLASQFAAWGDSNSRFIQPVGASTASAVIKGAGSIGGSLVSGNSCIFIGADTVHPSPSGIRYLPARYAQMIQQAWAWAY